MWAFLALWLAVPAQAEVLYLADAQVVLAPEGLPTQTAAISLPHRWDAVFPGRDGRVEYRLMLPPNPRDVSQGLYVARLGNQYEIYVGKHLVGHSGVLGNPRVDTSKVPVWVPLAAELLSTDQPTALVVRISVQAGRWGGMTPVAYGPEQEVAPLYRSRNAWQLSGTVAVVFCLAFAGLMAAGLWWVQRDNVFGFFALGAMFGLVRYADRFWETPPLPWPLWGGVMAFVLALHFLYWLRFALALLGVYRDWFAWVFGAMAVVELVLITASFGWGVPWLWSAALALLSVLTVPIMVVVVRAAWRDRQPEAIFLCMAGAVGWSAGLRDLVLVRLSRGGGEVFSLLPLATMLVVLLMAWLIISRALRQKREYQALMMSLDAKVREREGQLNTSHAKLQVEHAQRATLLERQRIMRDIHDGVGAQLVGLLSLIGKGDPNQQQLQQHARMALDELRMAVDSTQPVEGDLTTVLATLRYRLQPRLDAAGIKLDWQVEILPTMPNLSPTMVLHLQRILLEAFTNVLRHANASQIRVRAWHEAQPSPRLIVSVEDNGVGLRPVPSQDDGVHAGVGGQGIKNIHARAQAIGATATVATAKGGGTAVKIVLPLLMAD